jgi:hypothetical protein
VHQVRAPMLMDREDTYYYSLAEHAIRLGTGFS